jgi:CRP-like cAMP-binding protein
VRRITRDAKLDALKRAPIFEDLSRKELIELAKVTDDVELGVGGVLCREGTRGQEFFVIIEGEAEALRHGQRVATFASGEFFGEIALIADVERTATVAATTPLRCFVMTRQSFLRLLDANPRVERKVLRALARRLAALTSEHPL